MAVIDERRERSVIGNGRDSKAMSSSSSAPCAACKVQRRKCIPECIFAPYFPPDHPEKFIKIHKVFGASNVAKILNELPACHREDAVNSLAFEADARLKDPVYGCVGLISMLQHRLKQVKLDLDNARLELAHYIGPSAMVPMFPQGLIQQYNNINIGSSSAAGLLPYNMAAAMVGFPTGVVSQHGVGQLLLREPKMSPRVVNAQSLHVEGTQQLAAVAAMAVREEQEIMRTLEQQQHHHHLLNQQQQQQQQLMMKLNPGGGYDQLGGGPVTMVAANGVGVGGGRFDQVGGGSGGVSPSLALGAVAFDDHYQIHQQRQQEQQETLMLLQQPPTPQQSHTEVVLSAMYSQHDQKPEERSVSDDGAPLGGGCSSSSVSGQLICLLACVLSQSRKMMDVEKKITSDESKKGR
ncbi:LOB domain-containing protein [Drosera capensis]